MGGDARGRGGQPRLHDLDLRVLSPSRNISCEINYQREPAVADEAYCQTNDPPQSVRLSATGVVTNCTGVSCLGNACENTPTLGCDQTAGIGPFSCTPKPDGVACTVTSDYRHDRRFGCQDTRIGLRANRIHRVPQMRRVGARRNFGSCPF